MSDDWDAPGIRGWWARHDSDVIAVGFIGGGLVFCVGAGVGLGMVQQSGVPRWAQVTDLVALLTGLGVVIASWTYLDWRDNERRTRMR